MQNKHIQLAYTHVKHTPGVQIRHATASGVHVWTEIGWEHFMGHKQALPYMVTCFEIALFHHCTPMRKSYQISNNSCCCANASMRYRGTYDTFLDVSEWVCSLDNRGDTHNPPLCVGGKCHIKSFHHSDVIPLWNQSRRHLMTLL